MFHWLHVVVSKSNVSKLERKMIDRMVKITPKVEMGQSRREVYDWVIEIGSKRKVSEIWREMIS